MKLLSLVFAILFSLDLYAENIISGEVSVEFSGQNESAKDLLTSEIYRYVINRELETLKIPVDTFYKSRHVNEPAWKEAFKEIKFLNYSRPPANPNQLFLKWEADIDQNKLKELILTAPDSSTEADVFLQVNYELAQITWTDMGVIYAEDFSRAVEKSWLTFLSELDPRFKKIQKLSGSPSKGKVLNLNLRFSGQKSLSSLNPGHYITVSGSTWIKSLSSGKIDFDGKIEALEKFYPDYLKDALSSSIANQVYRQPLPIWGKLKNISFSNDITKNELSIELLGLNSSTLLFHFNDLVREKLQLIKASAQVIEMTTKLAKIKINYVGEEKKLVEELKKLDAENYILESEDPLRFRIKPLNQVGTP